MAVVELSIRIRDGQGQSTSTRAHFQFPDGATLAQVNTALGAWETALNNVTGGVITEILMKVPLDISGLTPNTPSGAIYASKGVGMSFPNVVDTHPFDFVVPARATATVASNKVVVTEGGLVDLLTDIMGAPVTTITAADSAFVDEDGSALTLEPECFPSDHRVGKAVRGSNRVRGV